MIGASHNHMVRQYLVPGTKLEDLRSLGPWNDLKSEWVRVPRPCVCGRSNQMFNKNTKEWFCNGCMDPSLVIYGFQRSKLKRRA